MWVAPQRRRTEPAVGTRPLRCNRRKSLSGASPWTPSRRHRRMRGSPGVGGSCRAAHRLSKEAAGSATRPAPGRQRRPDSPPSSRHGAQQIVRRLPLRVSQRLEPPSLPRPEKWECPLRRRRPRQCSEDRHLLFLRRRWCHQPRRRPPQLPPLRRPRRRLLPPTLNRVRH